jgi:hypothetical protein
MAHWRRGIGWLFLLAFAGASCSHGTEADCVALPCPMPIAVILTVTSTDGGPVPSLTMTISGATSGSGPCTVGQSATTCGVPGTAGTYDIQLSAPGFQGKALTVAVEGTNPRCACPTVQAQRLNVALSRV